MSVVQGIVCRPSTSGDVIVLANCEVEIAQPSSNSSTAVPSEYLAAKIIENRAKLHFNNDGKIEIDGFFIHYAVSLDGPGPLIYACVAEPEIPSDRAQQFLLNVKVSLSLSLKNQCGSESEYYFFTVSHCYFSAKIDFTKKKKKLQNFVLRL
ncbi:unnamed protein product [Cylicostephanus goldi]|uniref:Uncharacterized protein n=1 Tax=Cylicostephanus goldi TaxID=71465 RepID=A0A3P7PV41_CYLGO|nr:unnamed protein product [Cylicostephanus goldi]